MIIRKCHGCGVVLQNVNENEVGYTKVLKEDTKYCMRCHRLINYNELPKIVAKEEEYITVIDDALKNNGMFIYVVDIFNFYSTFNKVIIDKLRNKNILVVINKYDVLPKSTKPMDVINFVSKEFEKLFVKIMGIHIISALKGYFIKDLIKTIDLLRNAKDVYIVGCANVGKSTLINQILKSELSLKKDIIATSIVPGTTLKDVIIPFFDDNKAFIDTPGLISKNDIINYLKPEHYKLCLPTKEINAITYQLYSSYTYLISEFCAISFLDIKNSSITFYLSNKDIIKKQKTDKFLLNLNKDSTIFLDNTKLYNEKIDYKLTGENKFYFNGFGFFIIRGDVTFSIYLTKNVRVIKYDGFKKINR